MEGMKDLENVTGMSSAACLMSKQFKLFQGKSAQTPGKADPIAREGTLLWWAKHEFDSCHIHSKLKEKGFETALFG